MSPKDVLKKYFGYEVFRDTQEKIIDFVLKGNDAVVVMPTGGGKSVCFQVPAMIFPGITIVISPLIALMKDQVDGLNAIGIPATTLNSSMSNDEQRIIINRIQNNEIKLLYIAPERLTGDGGRFLNYLQQLPVSLFAIDEAHCVSMWGHDFRPEYLQMALLKKTFPNVPIIALTASADKITRADIAEKLGIPDAKIFISSFNRPNIHYFIERKKNAYGEILEYLEKHKNVSGIIYALSRKSTETLAENLTEDGFPAACYHAGLDAATRAKVQEDFKKDKVKIIVATIAFGMGIDKPDVRFVMHYNVPKNIESYYQETGRAGRDGLHSDAILYYSYGDITVLKNFASIENNPQQSDILLKKLDKMASFCSANQCRRKMLMEYFNEEYTENNCGSCDFCLSKRETFDATVIAQKALSAVLRTEERFGINYLIDVLRGSKSEKIWKQHKEIKTYGIGADISKELWNVYFKELIDQQYLKRIEDGNFSHLVLAEKSKDVLYRNEKVYLTQQEERIEAVEENVLGFDKELFEQLRFVRTELAAKEGVPPYLIMGDVTLQELSTFLPQNTSDLEKISGFGEIKIEKYGSQFLNIVKGYCEINRLHSKMDQKRSGKQKKVLSKIKPTGPSDTKKQTLYLFRAGKTITDIAAERSLAITTIEGHLSEFILSGEIKVTEIVEENKIPAIKLAIKNVGDQKLTPIKEFLGENYSFGEIRAVIAEMKRG